MAAVASATNKAADAIEGVKEKLKGIYRDAQAWGFSINPATGEVTPTDKGKMGLPLCHLQQMELQERISKVLADANTADADLARAITMAGNDATGPSETRPDVRAELSQPLPDDPNQFHDLWEKLTPEEKDWLYQQDHSIGNHDGMPAVDRDHYNRLALADELKRAGAAAAQADALKNQHADWAEGKNIPEPNKPGAIFQDRLDYEAWQRQYDNARNQSKYLPDLQAVDKAVRDKPSANWCCWTPRPGAKLGLPSRSETPTPPPMSPSRPPVSTPLCTTPSAV